MSQGVSAVSSRDEAMTYLDEVDAEFLLDGRPIHLDKGVCVKP
jgi:hypothetical protein